MSRRLRPGRALLPSAFNETDVLRFYRLLRRSGEGCWEWQGYLSPKGYGQMKINGSARWAHRVSFALHCGPIPDGHTIHHGCFNPCCVNPEHLHCISFAENSGTHKLDKGVRRWYDESELPPF